MYPSRSEMIEADKLLCASVDFSNLIQNELENLKSTGYFDGGVLKNEYTKIHSSYSKVSKNLDKVFCPFIYIIVASDVFFRRYISNK